MIKTTLLLLTLTLAILNGIFSPKLIAVFALQNLWYPFFLPQNLQFTFAISAITLACAYLMLAAIPAALFEKFTGQTHPTKTTRAIWLTTMAAITWPSFASIVSWLGWQ